MKWKLRRWRKFLADIYPGYTWWIFPANCITLLFLQSTRRYKGIVFADCSIHSLRHSSLSIDYFTLICDALDLLRDSDPRRFHLVQREIRYVVNQQTSSHWAEYIRLFRRCLIQLESFVTDTLAELSEEEYCWYVATIASTLVHEATHGRIMRYHPSYGKRDWQRIELMCKKQQQCFAERITDPTYDYARDLVAPLDVAWYETYLNKPKKERREERRAEAKLLLKELYQTWRN